MDQLYQVITYTLIQPDNSSQLAYGGSIYIEFHGSKIDGIVLYMDRQSSLYLGNGTIVSIYRKNPDPIITRSGNHITEICRPGSLDMYPGSYMEITDADITMDVNSRIMERFGSSLM